jgi:hypothetical protein
MDIDRYASQLPLLYDGWGTPDVRPKSARFDPILERIDGMTTPSVLALLNFAVECMAPEEVYCEVGTFLGASIIGALLGREPARGLAIDDFSEENPRGDNHLRWAANVAAFGLSERTSLVRTRFEDALCNLHTQLGGRRIGVYFYDGAHDFRSQCLGLFLVRELLSPRALLVVDDTNWREVSSANTVFHEMNPEASLLFDLPTDNRRLRRWQAFWNGVQVIGWRSAP